MCLFEVAPLESLRAELYVPEDLISEVAVGQTGGVGHRLVSRVSDRLHRGTYLPCLRAARYRECFPGTRAAPRASRLAAPRNGGHCQGGSGPTDVCLDVDQKADQLDSDEAVAVGGPLDDRHAHHVQRTLVPGEGPAPAAAQRGSTSSPDVPQPSLVRFAGSKLRRVPPYERVGLSVRWVAGRHPHGGRCLACVCLDSLGDSAPTQGEAIQVLGRLYTSNMLQCEVPADAEALFRRYAGALLPGGPRAPVQSALHPHPAAESGPPSEPVAFRGSAGLHLASVCSLDRRCWPSACSIWRAAKPPFGTKLGAC